MLKQKEFSKNSYTGKYVFKLILFLNVPYSVHGVK